MHSSVLSVVHLRHKRAHTLDFPSQLHPGVMSASPCPNSAVISATSSGAPKSFACEFHPSPRIKWPEAKGESLHRTDKRRGPIRMGGGGGVRRPVAVNKRSCFTSETDRRWKKDKGERSSENQSGMIAHLQPIAPSKDQYAVARASCFARTRVISWKRNVRIPSGVCVLSCQGLHQKTDLPPIEIDHLALFCIAQLPLPNCRPS